MSVHVRGDHFRTSIINGREEMTQSPSPEAVRQLRLRYELGACTAKRYAGAGFNVVYQDIILGEDLEFTVNLLSSVPHQVVVLCPSPEVVAQREAMRDKTGYSEELSVTALDASLRDETPRLGLWLDTSGLSIDETVDCIVACMWTEGTLPGVPSGNDQ